MAVSVEQTTDTWPVFFGSFVIAPSVDIETLSVHPCDLGDHCGVDHIRRNFNDFCVSLWVICHFLFIK